MTDAAATLIDLREVKPYERNARTHSPAQIAQIKDSFRRFGWVGVCAYDEQGLLIGHGRRTAALEMWTAGETIMGPGKRYPLPQWHAPAVDVTGLTEEERRALIIADNKLALNAGWDEAVLAQELAALSAMAFDMPVLGFDKAELDALLGGGGKAGHGRMADEFLVPPFSVLNAREGWWQERKRQWIGLGIRSEIGRGEQHEAIPGGAGENAAYRKGGRTANGRGKARTFGQDLARGEGTNVVAGGGRPSLGGTAYQALSSHPRYYEQKTAAEVRVGRTLTNEEFERDHWTLPASEIASGTSIFDPVLCELVYRWFAPPGGTVLDPFAGGSVRGIVAAATGRHYVGVELRGEQAEANRPQWPDVAARLQIDPDAAPPVWHVGDSTAVVPTLGVEADLIFSCPPYGDLEIYSDDEADLSTMAPAAFEAAYAAIVQAACAQLRDDRFACFVVGDYRDKRGLYANFVSKTIAAFEAAGLHLYNEIILITTIGSLAIRTAKQFRATRKVGKSHQNVLVFVKGDPRKATKAVGPVDLSGVVWPEHDDE